MLISSCTVTTIAVHEEDRKKKSKPKKKRNGSSCSRRSSILKLVFFVARKQKAPTKTGYQKGFWKTMTCSTRPLLRVEKGRDEPPPAPTKDEVDCLEDPWSCPMASPEHSLVDGVCSLASAEDLGELENSVGSSTCTTTPPTSDDEDEPNEIDLRAEEFIQKFYEQMRLQSLESAIWLYS